MESPTAWRLLARRICGSPASGPDCGPRSAHRAAGRYDEAAHWLLRVAGTADVREHSFGSVKHRAAASLVAMDVDRGRCVLALAAATALRDEMLALPPEQRTHAPL